MSSAHLGDSAVHLDCLLQLGSALLGKHIQAELILCHVRQIKEDKLLLFNSVSLVYYLSLLVISVALSSLYSYLCVHGSVSAEPEEGPTGRRCAAGSYCPQGTSYMVPCPAGTFSSTDGDIILSVIKQLHNYLKCRGSDIQSNLKLLLNN